MTHLQSVLSHSDPVLSLHNVYLLIDDRVLLDDITLNLKSGVCTALSGPSGSGKSVLGQLIAGLFDNDPYYTIKGQINRPSTPNEKFNGPSNQAIKTGILFQDPRSSLDPIMRCGRFIDRVAQKSDSSIDERNTLLTKLNLWPWSLYDQKFPFQLSGGEVQRVALAAVMLSKPNLIITDEATSSLDHVTSEMIVTMLNDYMTDNHATWLFISHDYALINKYAHDRLVMSNGRLSEGVSPDEWIPQFTLKKKEKKNDVAPVMKIDNATIGYRLLRPWWRKNRIHQILTEINLTISPGDIIGLRGDTGSGKSTLGRTLAILQPLSSGASYWQGRPFTYSSTKLDIEIRQDIQYLIQDSLTAFNPIYRIGNEMKAAIKDLSTSKRSDARDYLSALIQQLHLDQSLLNLYPGQLSGGQIQRFAIIRALLSKPQLIIADEIFSGLDHVNVNILLNILVDYAQSEDASIVLISHRADILDAVCHRQYLIKDGRMALIA